MKAVGFLQNAWSAHYGGTILGEHWTRENWLIALKRSRTGQRLKLMECADVEIWYDESAPVIADNPQTVMPADLDYMRKVLNEQKPDVIITFGAPASAAMQKLYSDCKLPWMILPHPAYRVVTNDLFIAALKHLQAGFKGTMKIVQRRNANLDVELIQPESTLF